MKIKKLQTNHGDQFTDLFTSKAEQARGKHAFDRECVRRGIEHRLTKPRLDNPPHGGAFQWARQRRVGH